MLEPLCNNCTAITQPGNRTEIQDDNGKDKVLCPKCTSKALKQAASKTTDDFIGWKGPAF